MNARVYEGLGDFKASYRGSTRFYDGVTLAQAKSMLKAELKRMNEDGLFSKWRWTSL